jgi:hypothetical protein
MMAKAHMTFRIRRAEIFPAHTKIIKKKEKNNL